MPRIKKKGTRHKLFQSSTLLNAKFTMGIDIHSSLQGRRETPKTTLHEQKLFASCRFLSQISVVYVYSRAYIPENRAISAKRPKAPRPPLPFTTRKIYNTSFMSRSSISSVSTKRLRRKSEDILEREKLAMPRV
jgi:hypothetical protein